MKKSSLRAQTVKRTFCHPTKLVLAYLSYQFESLGVMLGQ